MNLEPNELATFFNLGVEGWEKGLKLVCERYAKKAAEALYVAEPDNAHLIAKQQERVRIFSKELPGIIQQIIQFRAEQAQAAGKP